MSTLEAYYKRAIKKGLADKEIVGAVYKYWVDHKRPCSESLYQRDDLQTDGLELVGKLLEIIEKSR